MINRVAVLHKLHPLTKEELSQREFLIGVYNYGSVHWILVAVNLHKKLFYYLDPYGPSPGVCNVYTALVKYFKMRFESLEKDKVDIEGCKFVQLKMRVQTDGSNCGIYCLKMAEQLLTEGTIDEQFLKCLPLQKAREDIGVSLLANSSVHLLL